MQNEALFTVFQIIFGIFKGTLYTFFFCRVLPPKKRGLIPYIICGILTAGVFTASLFTEIPSVETWIVLIPLAFSLIFLSGSIMEKLLWSAAMILVAKNTAGLTFSFFALALQEYRALLSPGLPRFFMLLTENLLTAAELMVLIYINEKHSSRPEHVLTVALMNLLAALITDAHLFIQLRVEGFTPQLLMISIGVSGLLIVSIVLFAILSYYSRTEEERKLLLLMENERGRQLQEIESAYGSIREMRHDIRNQILTVSELIYSGKQQEGADYLKEISEQIPVIYTTGDLTFDALLTVKTTQLRDAGIRFDTEITSLDGIPLSSYDLCTIIGNLLDNAREAVEREKDRTRDPFVQLKILKFRKMFCIFCINPSTIDSASFGKRRFTLKKEEGHGLGLQIIRKTAEKYGGRFSHTADGHRFEACVEIPLSEV